MTVGPARLQGLFKILGLTNRFRQVHRTVEAVGLNRLESDSEHAFKLTMLASYLIEADGLTLDRDLVIRYCLVHDLVEAYAGDVDPHAATQADKELKAAREQEALRIIELSFKDFPSLSGLIHQYEARADRESKFVYALDKMQPILNELQRFGDYYRRRGVTLEGWLRYNQPKITQSPEAFRYFEELLRLLEEQPGLFALAPNRAADAQGTRERQPNGERGLA